MQEKIEAKPLFRENAIKNLNTINEIEATLIVTRSSHWVFILSSLLFLLGILIWSVLGQVSLDVIATGILLPENQFKQTEKLMMENLQIHQHRIAMFKALLDEKKKLYSKHYLTLSDVEKAEEEYLSAKEDIQNTSKIYSTYPSFPLFTPMPDYAHDKLDALVFVKHAEAKKIFIGMAAYILPTILSPFEYGYIKGKVVSMSAYPISKESAYSYLGNMSLVDEFFANGVPFVVKIQLEKNSKNKSELAWTTKRGSPFRIEAGTAVTVKIIYKNISPWQLLESYV